MPYSDSAEGSHRGRQPRRDVESAAGEPALDAATVVRSLVGSLADIAFLPGWRLLGARARRWMLRARVGRLDGAPVLLLPGVNESPRFLDPFAALALAGRRPVHVITTLGHNRSDLLATAEIAADYLERHDLRGVTIIAHSKGGLVGKQLMIWDRTAARIDRMLAVATPFSGSVFASRAPDRALRAFVPTDPTLLQLAANRAANARIVSAFPARDPQIPGGSALEDAARNVIVPVTGHFRVLAHPVVWQLARQAIRGA